MAAHFEDARLYISFSTFRDFPKRSSSHGEVGDSSGGMNVICSRPEVADGVITGRDVNRDDVAVV